MGLGDKIGKELRGWTAVAITIVIASVILLKFRSSNIGEMAACTGQYTEYNSTSNLCYNVTNTANTTAVTGQLSLTLDTFVSALSEPKNWIVIVIIAIIGVGVLALFKKGMSGGSSVKSSGGTRYN